MSKHPHVPRFDNGTMFSPYSAIRSSLTSLSSQRVNFLETSNPIACISSRTSARVQPSPLAVYERTLPASGEGKTAEIWKSV
nr:MULTISPECIES: hypothetical protein [Dickeya]